ncbi:class I adenylate-forming enzyme family protein [Micromonospora sp. KC723]|uniref:class I adenylate-forming enzyme family protein n=1 Tax=Micromonospora sp. KC723 TaxID=2530381 RepID=UPI001044490F|nr:class I adenylate-forming enzyme family protein [Micromonospora sp. KC723]TDB78456.1 long-chain fatty acid--CoA ligase [Micromonospora sp. KC723]
MSLLADALLPADLRLTLARNEQLGGGNVLRHAMAVHPRPDVPFLRLGRPVVDSTGQARDELSLRDLDRLAQSWSVWYREQGVRPRDRVAVFLEDSFAYAVHFYALSQIGAIPVLMNSRMSRPVAAEHLRRTAPVGMYTDRARSERLGDALSGLRWVQLAEELPAPPAAALPENAYFRHAPEDPVVILHSSGTTGQPKPVIQTHAGSFAGPRYRLAHFTEQPGSLMLAAQPQSHTGFIGYSMYAILAGTPLVPLFDPTGPELAAAIARYQPTMVLAFAHVYADLAAERLAPGSVDSVDGWVSMADAVHEGHMRRILSLRSPHLPRAAFYDRFGSTELGWGLMVRMRTLDTPRRDRCMGTPDPLAEFAVLREDGTRADVGEYGLLGVRSPSLTPGYWNDSDATVRSRLAGYWLTGDVGFQDEENLFYQVDRAVDVVPTAAGTGYSVLMEEVILAELPEIVECAVVAARYDGEPVAVAVVRPDSDASNAEAPELLNRINKQLVAAGQPAVTLLEVARGEADLPVGYTGKVLKRQLREKYAGPEAWHGDGRMIARATPEGAVPLASAAPERVDTAAGI